MAAAGRTRVFFDITIGGAAAGRVVMEVRVTRVRVGSWGRGACGDGAARVVCSDKLMCDVYTSCVIVT